jgi:hypothetical protein
LKLFYLVDLFQQIHPIYLFLKNMKSIFYQ